MASLAPKRMTLAEFLEWDDGTDRWYELVDGVPYIMAPPLEATRRYWHGLRAKAGVWSPSIRISVT